MSIIQAFKGTYNSASLSLVQRMAANPFAKRVFSAGANTIGQITDIASFSYCHFETRKRVNVLTGLKAFKEDIKAKVYHPPFGQMKEVFMEALIDRYDAFFVDLYGVVESSTGFFDGAIETLDQIADRGKLIIFVSNTGDRLPETIEEKFRGKISEFDRVKIITSGMCLEKYFHDNGLEGCKCINVGDKVAAEYIRRAGGIPLSNENIMDHYKYKEAKAVVVGYTEGFQNNRTLSAAINAIKMAPKEGREIHVVVTNTDEIASYSVSEVVLATASMARLIEWYTGIKAQPLGKPHQPIFELSLSQAGNISKDRILMIGDILQYDIKGATDFGIDSLLVLSGIHSLNEEVGRLDKIMIKENIFPTYILPSIKM